MFPAPSDHQRFKEAILGKCTWAYPKTILRLCHPLTLCWTYLLVTMRCTIATLMILHGFGWMNDCHAFLPSTRPSHVFPSVPRAANGEADATLSSPPKQSVFLTPELAQKCIQVAGGTPLYAYSLDQLNRAADLCLAFPNAYGLTVRYAMKALPNAAILQFFNSKGIHMDASSGYEVRRAIAAGMDPTHISLSTQELPSDFAELAARGVKINACSVSQLQRVGAAMPGAAVGIRINPGVGSGGFSQSTTQFSKTNVGGPSSSFGVWHELVTDGTVPAIVEQYNLQVERIHTHIGSGSDPQIWQQVAAKSLSFCELFPTVHTLNLGGGYKVGRNPGEPTTDLQEIGAPVAEAFRRFAADFGRELRLEIEPGTYLVAMAGALVSTVQDKVLTTGPSGHVFLKLDAGMTDVLRPSLYGAVHPMTVLPQSGSVGDIGTAQESVVVVGHCCESGDLMTPAPGAPEELSERLLRTAEIGDILVIDGSGAYCSGMSSKNYNSFPEAPEVLVDAATSSVHLIRARQSLEQIFENEVAVPSDVLKLPLASKAEAVSVATQ
jgi:diaminopimelate decarboxylase